MIFYIFQKFFVMTFVLFFAFKKNGRRNFFESKQSVRCFQQKRCENFLTPNRIIFDFFQRFCLCIIKLQKTYLSSTVAPTALSFSAISFASFISTFSLTVDGRLSQSAFDSPSPRPVISRSALIVGIF